jgi:type I restriction enzyme M protein
MVSIRSNFFYTRTVPCVLWFLNRAKKTVEQKDRVLMIDARNVYRKVTRKINDFSPEQEQNLLAIVWLYRGETKRYKELLAEYRKNGEDEAADWLEERFPDGKYCDVEGLVKAVTREEIAANDWSLTPGRYVGVAETDDGDEDFAEKFASLHEELRKLNAEAETLAKKIDVNFKELMG